MNLLYEKYPKYKNVLATMELEGLPLSQEEIEFLIAHEDLTVEEMIEKIQRNPSLIKW